MKRVPELDALRGLAILVVVVYHLYPETGTAVDYLIHHGWMAVDLFFLLSGYLITGILLGHPHDGHFLRSFYARRALRIWPLYYLAIGVLFVVSLGWPQYPFAYAQLVQYLTFTQEASLYWSDATNVYPPLGDFWSLAVEEQFYLLWPAVVLMVGRRRVIPVAAGLVLLAVAARGYGFHRHLLVSRCDALAAGAILAALTAAAPAGRPRTWLVRGLAATVGGAAVALATYYLWVDRAIVHRDELLGFVTPMLFGLVGLVICGQGCRVTAPLRVRWLCYLGTISYGLYVYHWTVYLFFDRVFSTGPADVWTDPIKVATAVAIAAASWRYLEFPILALKERFGYGRAAA